LELLLSSKYLPCRRVNQQDNVQSLYKFLLFDPFIG
jgi:hypothetical protein